MKQLITLLFILTACFPVPAQTEPSLYRRTDRERMIHWADSMFDAMSYDERIGQLFMVIANPSADTRNMQKLTQYIDSIHIGGVLFSKGQPAMQADVTNRLQKASHVPLLIALDGEWGLSMRLSETTRFPRNMMLGAVENDSLIALYGEEVGRQCREMGIHINFAPSLDVNSNTENPVIGTRSFGENPHAVADKGIAYARGLEKARIISVAKHFPGHGDTSEDSHHTLPVVGHNKEQLDSIELLPFKRYIREGFAGMMTAHLYVPALDTAGHSPASYSQSVVTGLLKKKYGFGGLLFTDALAMKGASVKNTDNPSVKALLAGNDVLLAPATPVADFKAVKQAIEDGVLNLKDMEARCLKILRYKYVAGLNRHRPVAIRGLSERINSPRAAWLAAKLNAEGITLLKNDSDALPLKQLNRKTTAVLSLGEPEGNAFQQMLNRYDSVACFSLPRNATAAEQQKTYKQLEAYDRIVCGVHTVRIPESEALRKLAAGKPLTFVFFTHPYFCRQYRKSIAKAEAVVMAYEGSPLAMEYAAQLIFGGIPAKGKLPVSIPGLYYAGSGIFTEKTRLGYHEPEEAGLDARRLAAIDTIVAEGLKEKAFPGCRVLVARKGMIVYDKAFGYHTYDRKQKVENSAVYDLASVTKAAGTLPVVMKMFDRKAFSLDSRISDFVPELKDSDKKDLPVKDLLYHQTGAVPSLSRYAKAVRRNVSDTLKSGFTVEVARSLYVRDTFRDTLLQEIKDSRLGTAGKYLYSCVNFVLLQKMVENQAKQPLDNLLRTHFAAGLGARTLTYLPLHTIDTLRIVPTENDTVIRRRLLRGYVHDEMAAFFGGVSGNAGLFSDAGDLAKILQLYLNLGAYGGERYLSEETVRLFTQSKSTASRRGLGFDKPSPGNPKASPCGELAPPSVYGHTGYTGTCFWVDPDSQMLYIFLSNRVYPSRTNSKLSSLNIRTRIQDAIYRAMDGRK
ncbi:MAG: serine hydrolase [Tannerellaceae bacterium]|jgi:beta-glucosidase-like glycosyl hydrolase/CubicO group peptidase (beta-lactamase class C family)|nr:serine hydrolase [Tannerellaceae bacterium]